MKFLVNKKEILRNTKLNHYIQAFTRKNFSFRKIKIYALYKKINILNFIFITPKRVLFKSYIKF